LYNSFTANEALIFTSTIIAFIGIGIVACLYQLITQDRIRRVKAYILQDGSKKFSKRFFSSPDWSLTKANQGLDSKMSLSIGLENMIKEEQVINAIKSRTSAKRI
jgi:hypothetical protein